MGTVPDPKRTVTADIAPQPKPVDPSASEYKPALDSKLVSVSAPQEQPSNLSLKTNGGGIKKSSDNSQPNNRRASNTLISPTRDQKPASTFSILANKKSKADQKESTFASSMADQKESTLTCPAGDYGKSSITSSTADNRKSTITPSTGDHRKSPSTSSTGDHRKSPSTSSMRYPEKSTITSSIADHKKPEIISTKDIETGKDLTAAFVSQSHDNSSARERVLPAAEKEDISKSSLSVSALTPSRPSSQANDTGGDMESSTEVFVQSKESSAKDTSEYSQAPHSETNVRSRSDQVSHRTHTASLALTTKQDETADVGSSRKDASLSAQSKDYKDAVRLSCVSPKSPAQTGNRPQTSEGEAARSISVNVQQAKQEEPQSPGAERSKVMSVSSATPAAAHKGKGDMESSSRTHLSFLPPSHPDSPGTLLSKPGFAATVGGTPTLNITAEETHEAQQGLGSRYKEAGTMTVSTEHRSTSKHSHHDAGVQAVAIVCSRSVGTSPGLTSQGGVLKLNGMATERQETLTVTCQRSSRSVPVYQITMDDSWSSQSGILSDVCGQTVVSSQIHRESSLLTSKQICDHLPGPARQKGGQSNSQTTGVIHHSDPVLKPEGKGQGTTSKEAVDTTQKWLPLLQPVYQINIEPCSQSNMTSSASTCNKESLMLDSTCHHKPGTESGSGRQQGARGCFPVKADSNNVCQGSAETRSVMPPAVRPSPAQVDNLLPGALTVAESEKDQEEANPSLLNPAAEGKQVTGRLKEGLKQQAPKKQDGRACKAGQSEAGGKKKKKESERRQTNEEVRKEQSQSGSRGKAGKAKGIHDVVWDEQGMTWEVYGASADPESLGFAIQNHLQSKIKEQERLIKAQVERRRSEAPCSPAGKRTRRRQPKMFRSLMKNVRRPNCCARPPPSSVLE